MGSKFPLSPIETRKLSPPTKGELNPNPYAPLFETRGLGEVFASPSRDKTQQMLKHVQHDGPG